MAHLHGVIDADKHFVIDAATREITNQSDKITLMQNDHNSERFTFEIPREIDGHDMSLCNVVRVHYLNIDTATKEQNPGVYDVEDLQISPDDETVVAGSWLISANATKHVGNLNFTIRFKCVADDGSIKYAWSSAIFKGISIGQSYNNSGMVAEEYADILAQWQARIEALEQGLIKTVDSLPTENISTSTIYLVPASGNLISASVDENEEIYNGKGYKENVSYNVAVNEELETTDIFLTGYIPIEPGDLFSLKNIGFNRYDINCKIIIDKEPNVVPRLLTNDELASNHNANWDASGNLISFEIANIGTYKYMRIQAAHIDEASIITVNKKDGNSFAEYVYVNGEWERIGGGSGSGGLTAQQAADLTSNTKARHTHANKTVLDKFSVNESGNPLFDGKPIASEGASGSVSINPRATMAQTVALLLESSTINVSLETPDVASADTSDFAALMFNLTSGNTLLYAPSEDGNLTYLDIVTYESVTIPVSAGGIYEFYIDMDVYEMKVNSYFGEGVLAYFKSKLLEN